MNVLNLLLQRMKQSHTDPESGLLEDIATFMLIGLLSLMTVMALL